MAEIKMWRAPEIIEELKVPQPDREKMLITARSFGFILDRANLSLENLKHKKILSLGNGLSNFAQKCNTLGENTECFAVDPIYGYLGGSYEDFLKNLPGHNLTISEDVEVSRDDYENIKKDILSGKYITGEGEALPFALKTFDLIVISHLLLYIKDNETIKNILDEALRVLKPSGEIRICEFNFFFKPEDNSISLNLEGLPLGFIDGHRWLEMFQCLEKEGCALYTVLDVEEDYFKALAYHTFLLKKQRDILKENKALKKQYSPKQHSELLRLAEDFVSKISIPKNVYHNLIIKKKDIFPQIAIYFSCGEERDKAIKSGRLAAQFDSLGSEGSDNIKIKSFSSREAVIKMSVSKR